METLLRLANGCLRRNHEHQRIGVNHRRNQALIAGIVADHAQFQVAVDQLRRNLARKAAPHLHLDLGIELPVALDMAQQVKRGGFVRADGQPAGRIIAQLGQRVLHLLAQVLEAPRVLQHRLAGVGEHQVLARTGRSASRPAPAPAAAAPARRPAACAAASRPRAKSSSRWRRSGKPAAGTVPYSPYDNNNLYIL